MAQSSLTSEIFTRNRVVGILLLIGVLNLGVWAWSLATADGRQLANGQPLGGDFVAFNVAANAAVDGNAASLYDPAQFNHMVAQANTGPNSAGLTWQYPPHYLLILTPLARMPFTTGYLLWMAWTAVLLAFALRRLQFNWLWIGLTLISPAGFHALATGQNGFFTAGLLALAAFAPQIFPGTTGLAAGVLTMKPHLGILLPVFYLTKGAGRAFVLAAALAMLLFLVSGLVLGLDTWEAFFDMLGSFGGAVSSGEYPLDKMQTVFAALKMWHVPSGSAMVAQLLVMLGVAGFSAWLWRKSVYDDLSMALVCAGAFLCTPYGYYYELIVLAPAVLVLIRAGLMHGFLPLERPLLAFCVLAPTVLPMAQQWAPIPLGLLIVVCVYVLTAQRILQIPPPAID